MKSILEKVEAKEEVDRAHQVLGARLSASDDGQGHAVNRSQL